MGNDNWGTPQWLFDALNAEFHFKLDACASSENAKCKYYYDIQSDGLKSPWANPTFCNPPYSDQSPWIAKAIGEGTKGITSALLLMCDTSTQNFRRAYDFAREIRLFTRRIKFEGAAGSPRFASMLAVFDRKPAWRDHARIFLCDYEAEK